MQVKGTAGKVSGRESVTSLTFVTNQRVLGPYGRVTGRAFESSLGGEVSGFFGRSGSRLDQIGVITKSSQCGDHTPVLLQGPWGGSHGVQFCSGRGEVAELFVTFNKAHIVALQVTYNLGAQMESIKSDCWGGEIGETVKVFAICFCLPVELQLFFCWSCKYCLESLERIIFLDMGHIPGGSARSVGLLVHVLDSVSQ